MSSNIEQLRQRSNNNCELCINSTNLSAFELVPGTNNELDKILFICPKCTAQIDKKELLEEEYWRSILETSMWSETIAVQVASWRLLNRFKQQSWAQDLLDMLYLDDTTLGWAKSSGDHENDASVDLHMDSNGVILQTGDTVILNKTLDVKGSTLKASVGTVVKNIKLVPNNTEQIECKLEGQTIIILTKYVRKQN